MGELSGSLLQVLADPVQRTKADGYPLWVEFPVDLRNAPFLVSATRSVLWVNPHGGKVRAALRQMGDLGLYFQDVVTAVADKGLQQGWGNVDELTKTGLENVIEHVQDQTLGEVPLEILANPILDWSQVEPGWAVEKGELPLALLGLPLQPATWLPPDTVVVVPRDRAYVGFAFLLLGRIVSVVHNSCRTMGIARGRSTS